MSDEGFSDMIRQKIIVSPEEYDRLLEILNNPPPPNAKLKALAKKYANPFKKDSTRSENDDNPV